MCIHSSETALRELRVTGVKMMEGIAAILMFCNRTKRDVQILRISSSD
jgi:hypothetical protein